MSNILVVGGAGYIGAHCCKQLHISGFTPIVLDNLSTGHRDFVSWGPFQEGDVRDKRTLLNVLDRFKPAAVMHFAAKSLVGESVEDPRLYYDNNVVGTLTLLECMNEKNINKLVFSSTCAIYADPNGKMITENSIKGPVSPYGFSKLVCEKIMDDFDSAYGLKSVRLRYFNAAGADQNLDIGEHHTPETHLIPVVLDAALGRRNCVEVFGNDYPTSDGSAVRDYIHVLDLVSAHIQALKYLFGGGSTVALNLGTGKGSSVIQTIHSVENVVGSKISKKVAPRRAGDSAVLVADPSQAKKILGWTAKHPQLSEIIADAWRWHQKRFAS